MQTGKLRIASIVLLMLSVATSIGVPQMAPKTLSIVRNDGTEQLTIEFHSGDQWSQLKLDAQKDTSFSGDRIRVATTREDKATITVDLPTEGGKKYRLFWNDKTSMWDFSSAS